MIFEIKLKTIIHNCSNKNPAKQSVIQKSPFPPNVPELTQIGVQTELVACHITAYVRFTSRIMNSMNDARYDF